MTESPNTVSALKALSCRVQRTLPIPVPIEIMRSLGVYLGAAVGSSAHTESDEMGVGQLHQDVVHTVDVEVLHPAPLHVLQHLVVHQGLVQTAVSI